LTRQAATRLSRGIPKGPLETEESQLIAEDERAAHATRTHVTRQHHRKIGPMTTLRLQTREKCGLTRKGEKIFRAGFQFLLQELAVDDECLGIVFREIDEDRLQLILD
jgi:hypothetical protein